MYEPSLKLCLSLPPRSHYHLSTCLVFLFSFFFILLTQIFSATVWYQLLNTAFTANRSPSCFHREKVLSVVVGGGGVSRTRTVTSLWWGYLGLSADLSSQRHTLRHLDDTRAINNSWVMTIQKWSHLPDMRILYGASCLLHSWFPAQ